MLVSFLELLYITFPRNTLHMHTQLSTPVRHLSWADWDAGGGGTHPHTFVSTNSHQDGPGESLQSSRTAPIRLPSTEWVCRDHLQHTKHTHTSLWKGLIEHLVWCVRFHLRYWAPESSGRKQHTPESVCNMRS